MMGECLEIGYSTRPVFGIGELRQIRWNRNPLTSSQEGRVRRRNFSSRKLMDTPPTDEIWSRAGEGVRNSSSKPFSVTTEQPMAMMLPADTANYQISLPDEEFSSPMSLRAFASAENDIPPSSPRYRESAEFKRPMNPTKSRSHNAPRLRSTLTMQRECDRLQSENKDSETSSQLSRSPNPSPSLSYPEACRQTKPKCSRDICGTLRKPRTHEIFKVSAYCGLRHPIPPRRLHRRGFHSTTMLLGKGSSDKSTGCRKMDDICETAEDNNCGKPCKRQDACHREKVKCEKPQEEEKKKEILRKAKEPPPCRDSCLPRSKCDLPRTEPPMKMTYEKVTCPPSKFAKLASCPSVREDARMKYTEPPPMELDAAKRKSKKKKICPPPALPKPPCTPILLCPCPPPPKIHPGSCPCYEHKNEVKPHTLPAACPPKKPYPCPTAVHYCPPKKCEKTSACEKHPPNTRKP
ncbi:hypothetical protein EAI_03631 [Harpegnathos saltator]|uniref:Uncharacterized protein n=2 Tax=Harpegnathos saltator TaxID=610380 RepID=E2B2L0_HARSA|nr:hypothetical protein EAI_03631 [Harpegnathos saltator]